MNKRLLKPGYFKMEIDDEYGKYVSLDDHLELKKSHDRLLASLKELVADYAVDGIESFNNALANAEFAISEASK